MHQFQVVADDGIVEARGQLDSRKVVWRLFDERELDCRDDGAPLIVFRPPHVATAERVVIKHWADQLVGLRYGYGEIVLQALDGAMRKAGVLAERKPFFSRLGKLVPWTMICSGVGNLILVKAKMLPGGAEHWSPDGTFDHILNEGWEVVYQSPQSGYWKEKKEQKNA